MGIGKRDSTAQRLRAVALELFTTNGYDATTVAEISRAAGVTPMTFYRHFASKDLVLIDDHWDPHIATHIASQPSRWRPIVRIRAGIIEAMKLLSNEDTVEVRARLEIVAIHPRLRVAMTERNVVTEQMMVRALTDTGVTQLAAEVAVAATMGALTAALLDWGRSNEGTLRERIHFALDQL